ILDVLHADRQAHEIRGALRSGPFDAGAVLGEALDRAEGGRALEHAQSRGESLRGALTGLKTQRHHPAEAAVHLPRRDSVTGMRGESRIEDVRELRMSIEPLRDRLRVG